MQQRRENSDSHVSSDGIVGERCAEALSVSAPALSPGFRGIVGLINPCERHVEREGEIVERAGGGETVFLASGQRRKLAGTFNGAVVWHDFKNTVVDRAGFLFELALTCGCATGRRNGLLLVGRFLTVGFRRGRPGPIRWQLIGWRLLRRSSVLRCAAANKKET